MSTFSTISSATVGIDSNKILYLPADINVPGSSQSIALVMK